MPYEERKSIIAKLEKARGSRILVYFLSDRETLPAPIPGFVTQMAHEPQMVFIEMLRKIRKTQQLDLFLYTRGGMTDSVWPLVNHLREHCEKLAVIVPFRCHSAGTLVCLGADEVIMTDSAELSPIDPTAGNQFNPADPTNPQNKLGISVEDVAAYFELARERAGIRREGHTLEVFRELTKNVHPLAVGNVQRAHMQIRSLARRLLALHLGEGIQARRIEGIVKTLTTEFYSHVHAINRREAMPLLGWVRVPTPTEEPLIWDLFDSYAGALELGKKFNLPDYMTAQQSRDLHVLGGFIESTDLSYLYTTDMVVNQVGQQIQLPGMAVPVVMGKSYNFELQKQGWVMNNGQV
jgi:serine dehydrogenase proteinase